MNKEQAIEHIEKKLNVLAEETENYVASEEYAKEYDFLPPESNFMYATVCLASLYTSDEHEAYVQSLVKEYGYYDKTELFTDLWEQCSNDITFTWRYGYHYCPTNKIVFDVLEVNEKQVEIPEDIKECMQKHEIAHDDLQADTYISSDLWGYVSIDGTVSFELDIETALEYLKNRD